MSGMRWLSCASRRPGPWAWLLAVGGLAVVPGGEAVVTKKALIDTAKERINVWYADPGNTGDSSEKDGVHFKMSKEDKGCGGSGVPVTFIEFDIDGVRPIDAFNVAASPGNQTQWDSTCAMMKLLEEAEEVQARGWAGVFKASVSSPREVFEWQVVDGNFTTEEFWVAFTTLEDDDLRQGTSPQSGVVVMANCLAGYKITKTDNGVHMIITQQPNSYASPFSARTVAEMSWSTGVTSDWAKAFTGRVQQQAKLGWNATDVAVPKWMMVDRPCGAPKANVEVRKQHLNTAVKEMHRPVAEFGKKMPDVFLSNQEKLEVWMRNEACGSGNSAVPLWHAQFTVPGANPAEVFNVLANQNAQVKWNSILTRVNSTGFYKGARGVHETYKVPVSSIVHDRELWEWQVANHSFDNNTYLLAFVSAGQPTTEKFSKDDVEAVQCLAAYEMSPAAGRGTLVHMSDHLDPKVWLYSIIAKAFEKAGQNMLKDFAEALTNQSEAVGRLRSDGAGALAVSASADVVDSDALELLAPPPPMRNLSISMADILSEKSAKFRMRLFADLSLPQALNSSSLSPESFKAKASEAMQVFQHFARNASKLENQTFSFGVAADAMALQLQGEALQALQLRIFENLAAIACNSSMPDINNNKPGKGMNLALILAGVITVFCAFLISVTFCCCWKCKRRSRQLRAAAAAAALLSATTVTSCAEEGAASGAAQAEATA